MKLPLFLLSFIVSFNQAISQRPIDSWKSYSVPVGDEVFKYNSDSSWFVSLDSKGQVVVENKIGRFPTVDSLPFKPYFDTIQPYRFRGFRTVKKVDNGYLFGFNKGEFGGSLHWFSPTGDSTYKISNGLVNYIFENRGKIFIAHGLAHLGSDDGGINEMVFTLGKWKIDKGVDIKYNPQVFLPLNNQILIVTSETILLFKRLQKIKYIKKKGFWDILYPQSAVLFNDELYVGMRGGVYKINLNSGKEEWLRPR